MEKYIALLRGINISGKNKIAMPLLKDAFEEVGFSMVSTYINSGNVIFSSDIKDKEVLIRKCKSIITENFNYHIPIALLTGEELSDILQNAPIWWNVDKEAINYAIFVIPPMTVEEVFTAVGSIKPEYEKVAHFGNVIFWSTARETFSKAKWSKIASSSINNNVTIRNANTANKLLLLTR